MSDRHLKFSSYDLLRSQGDIENQGDGPPGKDQLGG